MTVIRGASGHPIYDADCREFVGYLLTERDREPWTATEIFEIYVDWFADVQRGEPLIPLSRGQLFRALSPTSLARYRVPTGQREYRYRFISKQTERAELRSDAALASKTQNALSRLEELGVLTLRQDPTSGARFATLSEAAGRLIEGIASDADWDQLFQILTRLRQTSAIISADERRPRAQGVWSTLRARLFGT